VRELYAGVDGGGTRTRALLVDAEGAEVSRAEGPASLADPARPEVAADAVLATVRAALERVPSSGAGASPRIGALFAGLAGTGRETTRSGIEAVLRRAGVAERVRVDADTRSAFFDAFDEGPGMLLVAGTGSMAWGRNEGGKEARVGGWGSLLGDEGSGYGIGLEALRRVTRSADGRGPDTGLASAILGALGMERTEQLVGWAAEASKADIAALAPVVAQQSRAGDFVAGEILVEAVEELESHVVALLETLDPWPRPPRVALVGGLVCPGGPLRPGIETVLSRYALQRTAEEPDPTRGAAALARTL